MLNCVICILYFHFVTERTLKTQLGQCGVRWLGGVVVRALDSRCADREFDSHAAAALLCNDLGQVVHTIVPLFTKQ